METKTIVHLLDGTDNENTKFTTRNWYVIEIESKGNYSSKNPIKFQTNSLESSLCDYSDAYILVKGNIAVTSNNVATKVAFKNVAPFRKCRMQINDTYVEEAENINITMPMYNLIEYSDNYSDTFGSLWQFKKDETDRENNIEADNSSSFKYKASLIGNTVADGADSRKKEDVKIAVTLKYLSNFWRSLEISWINCKLELSLTWNQNCTLPTTGTAATFAITNAKLSKLLSEGFKRPVYWNKYKVTTNINCAANDYKRTT